MAIMRGFVMLFTLLATYICLFGRYPRALVAAYLGAPTRTEVIDSRVMGAQKQRRIVCGPGRSESRRQGCRELSSS